MSEPQSCFPDYWELQHVPGYFENFGTGTKADWLQTHRSDPYWLAHEIYATLKEKSNMDKNSLFIECWKFARDLKMEWEED